MLLNYENSIVFCLNVLWLMEVQICFGLNRINRYRLADMFCANYLPRHCFDRENFVAKLKKLFSKGPVVSYIIEHLISIFFWFLLSLCSMHKFYHGAVRIEDLQRVGSLKIQELRNINSYHQVLIYITAKNALLLPLNFLTGCHCLLSKRMLYLNLSLQFCYQQG